MTTRIVLDSGVKGFAENKETARAIRLGQLLPALDNGDDVVIDFAAVRYATQSFVHALIGEGLQKYREAFLERVEFKNCSPQLQSIIELVVDYSLSGFPEFKEVTIGPLGLSVIQQARWRGEDKYPAWQDFADELENLLEFAKSQGQYDRYFAELTATRKQRDSALDELRVALHFCQCGFQIAKWKPIGQAPKEGEYLVFGPSGINTFVEVKSPTWESELTEEQRTAGRTKQPKYLPFEGGAFALRRNIQYAVDKAYGKLSPTTPNLLVIPGDGTFVSMRHETEMHANQALYDQAHNGRFTKTDYEKLGGVAIFWTENNVSPIQYRMKLFSNPYAIVHLPDDFEKISNTQR